MIDTAQVVAPRVTKPTIETRTLADAVRNDCALVFPRRNALFAGSDGGGRTWATPATRVVTAELNGADPRARLTLPLERNAAGWPNRRIAVARAWTFRPVA